MVIINFSNKSPIHILTHTRYDIGTRSDRDDGSKGYQPPYVTFGSTENQQIFLSGNSTFAEEGSGDGDGYGDGTVDPVSPGQDPCNAVISIQDLQNLYKSNSFYLFWSY